MPRLPKISSKKAVKVLESLGFEKVRQTGSHVSFVPLNCLSYLAIACQDNY